MCVSVRACVRACARVCATWAHHATPGNFEEMMHFAAFKTHVYVNQIRDMRVIHNYSH